MFFIEVSTSFLILFKVKEEVVLIAFCFIRSRFVGLSRYLILFASVFASWKDSFDFRRGVGTGIAEVIKNGLRHLTASHMFGDLVKPYISSQVLTVDVV